MADRDELAHGATQVAATEPPTAPGHRGARSSESPTTLGRYQIVSALGEGGMGVVLLAEDPALQRRVALKILHRDAGGDEARRRLVREAQAVAQVSHDHVIIVHEVGTHDDQVYVAMEYVAGTTLRGWQAGRPWREIVEVYLRAGRGLAAAHRAGLVHRDFKPDNVLVGDDGRVRVTDFGLVAAIGAAPATVAPASGPSELAADLTRTGTVMGTPRYMAPEQHLGEAVDARADQFAFCVALYEALYRQPPFAGETLAVLAATVVAGEVRTPPASEVPATVREAILRGLARAPGDRFTSMHELLTALVVEEARPQPSRPRRRWPLVAGAIAFGAVASVAVVGLRNRGGEATDVAGMRALVPDDGVARAWAVGVPEADQQRALAQFRAGNEHLKAGEGLRAIAAYEAALKAWNHPTLHYNLALALAQQPGREREVVDHLDAALAYPDALDGDAVARGRDARRQALAQLAARGPRAGSASGAADAMASPVQMHFDEAMTAFGAGDFVAAHGALERAHAARPWPVFLFDQAICMELEGRVRRDAEPFGKAAALFRRYLESDPVAPDRAAVEQRIATLERRPPDFDAEERTGALRLRVPRAIESSPAGATIYLDNSSEPFAVTPWSGTLDRAMRVRIEKRGHAVVVHDVGPTTIALTVVLGEDPTTGWVTYGARVAGGPSGSSELRGADIFVDGTSIGRTPAAHNLTRGKHTVVISAAGYEPSTHEIDVAPGQEHAVNATMQRVVR